VRDVSSVVVTPRGPFSLAAGARFLEGFAPAAHQAAAVSGHLHVAVVPDGESRAAAVCVRETDRGVELEIGGAADAQAAREQVVRMLSLDVDAEAYPAVGERDPAVGALQAAHPGFRPVQFPSPFEAAGWFVLSQRARMSQAAAVKRRLRDELGEAVEICGERRVAFPAPEVIADLSEVAGVPARKREVLRGLARAALDGAFDGARLRALGGEAAAAELERLDGVGPFTAQGVVVRGAGEPDLLATAEPRLRQAAALAYGLAEPPSSEDLIARAEAWRPFRAWVTVLLRRALEGSRRA
jgi:3-methyladenine DNA glycosylase/8-oxoguanine DNA glycosylase